MAPSCLQVVDGSAVSSNTVGSVPKFSAIDFFETLSAPSILDSLQCRYKNNFGHTPAIVTWGLISFSFKQKGVIY